MGSVTGTFSASKVTPKSKKKKSAAAPLRKVKPPVVAPVKSPGGERISREIAGLIVTVFSLILLLSLVSFHPGDFSGREATGGAVSNWIGPVGAYLGLLLSSGFGVGAFALNALLMGLGVAALYGKSIEVSRRTLALVITLLCSACVLVHMGWTGERFLGSPMGGLIGAYLGEGMRMLFSTIGTTLVASTVFVIGVALLTGRSITELSQSLVIRLSALKTRLTQKAVRPVPVEQDLDQATVARKGVVIPVDFQGGDAPEEEGSPLIHISGEDEKSGNELAEDTLCEDSGKKTDVEMKGPALVEIVKGKRSPGATSPQVEAISVELTPVPVQEEDFVITGERTAVDVPKVQGTAFTESVQELKIVESDAMKHGRSRGSMDSARQKSLSLDGVKKPYELPALSILNYEAPNNEKVSRSALLGNASVLKQKLEDFGVKGNVVEIHPGPVVTMYEFKPAPGIKISRIANLSDDLSMALAALRVRIVAPIPGKSVVGIEVPNQARETVYLKEILSDDLFQNCKMKVPIAIGKDIVGYPVVEDMSKMPHLLVAGSTGSGKSVAINSFICSILYRSAPEDVKMIMVDPKMLELSPYQGIPHLLLPVVTDPQKAALALKWAVAEMERRYRLMAETGVRSITGYNTRVERLRAEIKAEEKAMKKASPHSIVVDDMDGAHIPEAEAFTKAEEVDFELPEKLPFIVIIIDELADLMMVASKDVETSIARLAQMARAAGLHLIIATQRPSVDVVTGLIKANFPARMSFRVSSKIDSRTILDASGAENLLGMGDMLFMPPGSTQVNRVHGCFVSDTEVEEIVTHLKTQGKPDYCMEILAGEDGEDGVGEDVEYDEYYDQAVAIVAETRQASISYLQRRLKIGYNRAARIVDIMEKEGVIGPQKSTGRREVLIDPI